MTLFAATALKNTKAMGALFDPPMAVFGLCYFKLVLARWADQCKIGIKPIAVKIVYCIEFSVHH
jgi:hypothetical protein